MAKVASLPFPGTRSEDRFPEESNSRRTDRGLPRIRPPSEKDFAEICRTLKVPADKKVGLMNELVLLAGLAEANRLDHIHRETAHYQQRELRDIAKYLRAAGKWIEQFDTVGPHVEGAWEWSVTEPPGSASLGQAASETLHEVLAWEFLHRRDRHPSAIPAESDARLVH
jgi:hypothetical protein